MSQILDQIKHNIQTQLSKVYKDLKRSNSEDWLEFQAWFWKIRPHLNVDMTQYEAPSNSETSGPNIYPNTETVKDESNEIPV